MTEVTIKIRAFPYYVEVDDPVTGRRIRQERVATRGQTVDLSDVDLERAKRFDAIRTEADQELAESVGAPPGELVVESASAEQLAEWLRTEKPSVDRVMETVDDNPETAQRMLEAENLATGQQPRSTLVERLGDLIAAHQS